MINIIFSIISGLLLALAFPKFNLYWLAWVALVPFFIALSRARSWKESLLCGLLFGTVFFGINLFWLTTLFRFVGWWIVLGWLTLVLFQTLFILLFVFLLRFTDYRLRITGYRLRLILLPLIWTASEWLRAWGPFGVTAGGIGYSQAAFLPLIQIASFTSVYGISFLVVLVNATIANLFMEPATKRRGSVIFVLVLLAVVYGYGRLALNWNQEFPSNVPEARLKLALIQPNIDQKDKLNPSKVPEIFNIHKELTTKAKKYNPDIIIWPETAIFTYLLHDPFYSTRIKKLAIDANTWLVLGTPHYFEGNAYNSIISISPSGEVVARYDKEHLVPFGEYLPFRNILFPILKGVGYYDSEYNSNPKPKSIKAAGAKIAAAVCFESTLPGVIRKRVTKDTDFILLVTNDSWFNDSSALYDHLNCDVFRAIENRKYFIQVGNTGISAIIDPHGRILKRSKVNQREILTFEIPIS